MPTEEEKLAVECYKWSATIVDEFEEDLDYEYDHDKKTVELTREGRRKVRMLAHPEAMDTVGMFHIYQYVERAIKVDKEFFLDRQYVVVDGEIVIVDEFTGRMAEGRKWRDGIHQAVEAKQGVEVTVATGQAARVTVQDFFLRFDKLAGMTGTAAASAREMKKIYRCNVIQVPTNRPVIRQRLSDCVFGHEQDEVGRPWSRKCAGCHERGTPRVDRNPDRIDKSEILSRMLSRAGHRPPRCSTPTTSRPKPTSLPGPGERGKVTVSTNMAGRGTDIKLGEGVQ